MRVYDAIEMAILAHKEQIRKLDGVIYVAHPIEVGMMLAQSGASEEVIIAGILHDTVEDTVITLGDIEKRFGARVMELVKACSEEDKSLSWRARKEAMLEKMCSGTDDEVNMILIADKISNLQSIYRNLEEMGDSLWDCFNAGYEDQKWYFCSICDCLKDLAGTPFYDEMCGFVDKIFKD